MKNSIFISIFKNFSYKNQNYPSKDNKNISNFVISDNGPKTCDYEVSEISYEEFIRSTEERRTQERRKNRRKIGLTRRNYDTSR